MVIDHTGSNHAVCPLCGDVRVTAMNQLMTHILLMHADSPNFMIQCNLQGCKKTFRKFTVYSNHVYSFHDTALNHPELPLTVHTPEVPKYSGPSSSTLRETSLPIDSLLELANDVFNFESPSMYI